MIVNPDKFQAMIFQTQVENSQTNLLNIDNEITETTKSVEMLGITIDSQLRFDAHISNLSVLSQFVINVALCNNCRIL